MSDIWIYHERQDALLCGQHALNNLVQASVFSASELSDIAQQLDAMELTYMSQNDEGGIYSKDYIRRAAEGSVNADESGNFSIEVLRGALMNQYNLSLPNLKQSELSTLDIATFEGFICNRESHWFAIRKINGRYWNLNSTLERPEQISSFRLALEMEGLQREGYSVFCADGKLPPPCMDERDRQRGAPEFWWKEADLVAGKKNATNGATDPWRNIVGNGMRLDGRPTQKANSNLSEDEMLAMAISASMENGADASTTASYGVELQPEPSLSDSGAVRIQFRLPNGSKSIRCFLETESVAALYLFVQKNCPSGGYGKNLELIAGYPPKNISGLMNISIGEAKLSGESVTGRYV